jgi:hypothetical protein
MENIFSCVEFVEFNVIRKHDHEGHCLAAARVILSGLFIVGR